MDKNIARHISSKLAQSGRAVRVIARPKRFCTYALTDASTTYETNIVAINKVRGLEVWMGIEEGTGSEVAIIDVKW